MSPQQWIVLGLVVVVMGPALVLGAVGVYRTAIRDVARREVEREKQQMRQQTLDYTPSIEESLERLNHLLDFYGPFHQAVVDISQSLEHGNSLAQQRLDIERERMEMARERHYREAIQ